MAIICRSIDLLFIMAPRTACTAVGQILLDEFDGEYLPAAGIYAESGEMVVPRKHTTLRELLEHGVLTRGESDRLVKFTCVRNPFDSLVSLYVKQRETYRSFLDDPMSWVNAKPRYRASMQFAADHSFDDWIAWHYESGFLRRLLRRAPRSLYGRYERGVDRVLRFERLQEDFDALMRHIGVERAIEIPRINATAEREGAYRSYYSARSRGIIERALRAELRRHGYTF